MAKARTTVDIEAEIAASRRRLASTLDEIGVRVHPKTIMGDARDQVARTVDRTAGQAFVTVNRFAGKARSQVIAPDGSPRLERIVPLVMVTVAVVGLVATAARRKSD